jgi:hypothetical protein
MPLPQGIVLILLPRCPQPFINLVHLIFKSPDSPIVNISTRRYRLLHFPGLSGETH